MLGCRVHSSELRRRHSCFVTPVCGKLGTRSKGLIKEYHCDWTEDTPFTLKMTYKKLTSDEVIVEVNHYEGNR